MKYWKISKDKNFDATYSCDMLRINFVYRETDEDKIMKYFSSSKRLDVDFYSPRMDKCKFKYLLKIEHLYSTMVVGFHFNAFEHSDSFKGYIEFNPNKILHLNDNADDKQKKDVQTCLDDMQFIFTHSKSVKVARWDLAVDLPVKRTDCILMKDQRMYQLVMHSSEDRTEYLGRRSNDGYIKLYNKTIESNLDSDITRLELTLDSLDSIEDKVMLHSPALFIKNMDYSMCSDYNEMNITTKMLVDFIRKSDDRVTLMAQLDKRLRKKIKPYVFEADKRFYYNTSCIINIVTEIRGLVKEFDNIEIEKDTKCENDAVMQAIKASIEKKKKALQEKKLEAV